MAFLFLGSARSTKKSVIVVQTRKNVVYYNKRNRKTSDAEGGICLSCAVNEQAVCEADKRAPQGAGLRAYVEYYHICFVV